MTCSEEQGYPQKDIFSTRVENHKLNDMEFLKQQPTQVPFITLEHIKVYMKNMPESRKMKMYFKIRLQRDSRTILKRNYAMFCLKEDIRNLSTSRNILIKQRVSAICHWEIFATFSKI